MLNKNLINKFYFYLALIIISRLTVFFVFDIKPSFSASGQLIDLDFLRNNLFESLYYLHFQPFLWNLFFGIISKFFTHDHNVFMIGFLLNILFSVGIIHYICKIFDEIKISEIAKNIIILFIILNPNIIFYEYENTHDNPLVRDHGDGPILVEGCRLSK